jgi:hypothetical protein
MPDGTFNVAPSDEIETVSERKRKDPREVSTIGFPYHTLNDAIEVARAILHKGGVPMARDQLAAAIGLQVNSGNFTNKTAATRMFGLIETVAGKYQLTPLGFDILDKDEARVRSARARAFLNVPLYHKTHEEFRNTQLPPRPHGLENAFVMFGVASKQKDKARRAFENSARLAGFFEHGNDKLVAPVIGAVESTRRTPDAVPATDAPMQTQKAVEISPADHPFIKGLLLSLPNALGDEWSAVDRAKWLQAAATAFELMFKGGGTIEIKAMIPQSPRDQ